MVYKIGGYIITFDQARKLTPDMPPGDGPFAFAYFVKMLTQTRRLTIVPPVVIRWPAGTQREAIMLMRISGEDPTSTKEQWSPYEELEQDRDVKRAAEKLLEEEISDFTTMPHPNRE